MLGGKKRDNGSSGGPDEAYFAGMTPDSTRRERWIVRGLFVLVVASFIAAERASGPLKRSAEATAGRAASGAATTRVALR
ncbi:hypothetical protein GCM10028786_15960 [Flaviaesturariibacter terrae]